MSKLKRLWILFTTTFSISATTNGGYAIVAVMKGRFVEKYKWLSEDEMIDLMSLGQSCPGPIAINTSVLVGYKIAGLAGALVTLFGTVLPPLIIMSIVTFFYQYIAQNEYVKMLMKGMQAGVAALLVSIFIDMFMNIKKQNSIFNFVLAIIAFVFARYTDFSVFYLAIFCSIAGFIKAKHLIREVK